MLAPSPKIPVTVGEVKTPVACNVCCETIESDHGTRTLARNRQEGFTICGRCIAAGSAEIDQRLAAHADLLRKNLPARLEQIRRETEEYAAWLESLVGRLRLPSYARYQADLKAALDNELLALDYYDLPPAERVQPVKSSLLGNATER